MKSVHCTAVLALLASCLGCASEGTPPSRPDPRTIPAELQADVDAIVRGNTGFAVDFYSRFRAEPGNIFMSPYSISTALAMTYAGAAGVTADEMARALHFDPQQARFHEAYGAVLESLNRGTSESGYRLDIANRLWGDRSLRALPSFLDVTREHYDAGFAAADFSGQPEAARVEINDWVLEKTGDRIRDLLPQGSITTLTRLVLVNAIYFKGLWAVPFKVEDTRNAPFHVSPGRTVHVPMMNQTLTAGLGSLDGLQVLELKYGGNDLSMVFLLPADRFGLPLLEERLTADHLGTWLAGIAETKVDVSIPRFKMTWESPLNGVLAGMGMPSAFDATGADFSGLNGERNLYITAVLHKAFVEVNEKGTEAAGATGVVVGTTSLPPSFVADHPFLFLIRDNVTGSLLFMGRVADPS
jgi:serpin B